MSHASDKVIADINKYIDAMRDMGHLIARLINDAPAASDDGRVYPDDAFGRHRLRLTPFSQNCHGCVVI